MLKNDRLKCFLVVSLLLFLSLLSLELGVRHLSLHATIIYIQNSKRLVIISFFILFLLFSIFTCIFNNTLLSSVIIFFMSLILMISNHQKILFRGEPVFIYDFENILNISDLYRMMSKKMQILGIVSTFTLIYLAYKIYPIYKERKVSFFKKNSSRLTVGVVSTLLLCLFTQVNKFSFLDSFFKKSGYENYLWNPLKTSQKNGVIPSFLYTFPGDIIEKPDGYSQQTMLDIKKKYSQEAKIINQGRVRKNFENINVIYILSESLADPNNISAIEVSPTPIPFIKNNSQKVYSGNLIVPAYGGATPNTEYEILTSLDTHFLNFNMSLPYQNFLPSFKTFPSLSESMSDSHRRIAAHNHHSNFYQRRRNFETLGFEEVYFRENMQGINNYRNKNYASDASAYRWIFELMKSSSEPIFMHFITMQNHTPYPNIEESLSEFRITGYKEDLSDLESYLLGVSDTDRETKSFISEIEQINKPIIIVFYGDHHPPLYTEYVKNDPLGKYSTNYFVYTNIKSYKKVSETKPVATTEINNLVHEIGSVQVSPYQAFLSKWHSNFVGFVGNKLYSKSGKLISLENLNDVQQTLYKDYLLIQYDLLEGKSYLGNDFWMISE